MHERIKAIKAIAKSLRLKLPFCQENDNMHDLLDGIIALCDEPVEPILPGLENVITTITMTTDVPNWFKEIAADKLKQKSSVVPVSKEYKEQFLGNWDEEKPATPQWSLDPNAIANSNATTKVTAYFINDKWISVGIPKKQPFHEQVFWAANKGATIVKMEHEGEESEIKIYQPEP